MAGMFKALGNLATRQSTKESVSPKANRSGSNPPPTIARLVTLVRDGKIQNAMEELARVPPDVLPTCCLMAEPNNRTTLLHASAEVGSEEMAKAVVAYTGPPGSPSPLLNSQDKQGYTPFHVAASSHHLAICDFLLEKGANPNAQNQEKTTPFHYLIRQQFTPELEALLEKCLTKGADIEAKNKFGEAALQQACSRLNASAASWLIARKANVNSTNDFGETALHKVARFIGQDPNAPALMQTLIQAGADKNASGAHGTALDLIQEQHRTLVADLLPTGASLSDSGSMERRLRHADSSDKLKGMMAMLQKKRTMRQIVMAEQDLEASTRSTATIDSEPPRSIESSLASAPPPLTPSLESSSPSMLGTDAASVAASLSPPPPAAAAAAAASPPAAAAAPPQPESSMPPLMLNAEVTGVSEMSLAASARKLTSKLVAPAPGFKIELGRTDVGWGTLEIPVEAVIDYYQQYFFDKERSTWRRTIVYSSALIFFLNNTHLATIFRHWNFIGYMDHERTDPCIISVADTTDHKLHRAIIRTAGGSHQIFIPTTKIPSGSKHIEKDIIKALESDVFTSCQLWPADGADLRQDLLEYEMHEPERIAALPVGVIYAKEGQVSANEFWSNKDGSQAFNEFLELLGDKIALQGWSGYAGGLDVVKNGRGTHSVYTHWRDFDIMFHVSTFLPFDEWDPNKVQRSRVIGNDVVNIIFQEGDTPFPANALPGAVTYVFIVVRPELEDGHMGFRIGTAFKDGVNSFKPELSSQLLPREQLREILLAKAQKGPGLAKMYSRPRKALLDEIAQSHVPDIRKVGRSKKSTKGK